MGQKERQEREEQWKYSLETKGQGSKSESKKTATREKRLSWFMAQTHLKHKLKWLSSSDDIVQRQLSV